MTEGVRAFSTRRESGILVSEGFGTFLELFHTIVLSCFKLYFMIFRFYKKMVNIGQYVFRARVSQK